MVTIRNMKNGCKMGITQVLAALLLLFYTPLAGQEAVVLESCIGIVKLCHAFLFAKFPG